MSDTTAAIKYWPSCLLQHIQHFGLKYRINCFNAHTLQTKKKKVLIIVSTICIRTKYNTYYSQFFINVNVPTMDCQFSQINSFFHADKRPIFWGLKSASAACNQVWLGLPTGCFLFGGGFWIAAMTEWCWSYLESCSWYGQRGTIFCKLA